MIINFEQGSQEWLDWRKTVITSTDAAAIMLTSPWKTPYKCWLLKLSMIEDDKPNEAMLRGKWLEPIAREHFNNRFNRCMQPAVVESDEYEFLGASLDGIEGEEILEIKCGGEKLHNMAMNGIIPDYYMDQVQHQLLVTQAKKCYYYSFDGNDGICIEVLPDRSFKERFINKALEFWHCVAYLKPPELQPKDYVDRSDNFLWKAKSIRYRELDALIKELEAEKELVRNELIEMSEGQSSCGEGIKLIKTSVKGRVDYESIPELKTVNLDQYRKPNSFTWKILVSRPA